MDYKDLFTSMGIVLVGIIAFFAIAGDFNNAYGTNLGDDMNGTRTHVQDLLTNTLGDVSGDVGNATQAREGASLGSGETGLITRALTVITSIPQLFGLVPAVIRDGASVLGIPDSIVIIGEWVFLFAVGVTLAYLFLLGISRLRS